jgi:hypothetical protein
MNLYAMWFFGTKGFEREAAALSRAAFEPLLALVKVNMGKRHAGGWSERRGSFVQAVCGRKARP